MNASEPIRVSGRRFRCRLRRVVLAAIVAALAAASLARADDTPTHEPVKPFPERMGTDAEEHPLDQVPARGPTTPVPEQIETDPEQDALGHGSAAELVNPIPKETKMNTGQVALARTPAGVPIKPAPEEAQTDPEQDALGPAPAAEHAGTTREEAETDPERHALVRAPTGESAKPVPRTDPKKDMFRRPRTREPIKPITDVMEVDPEKVALGRALFHDPRLSKDNTTACVSCHDLGNGGDDGRKVSIGIEGKPGTINSPTVFNAGLNFKQFWDGRANTLEQQIDGPVQSSVELGSLWPEVLSKLHVHESYPGRFNTLYPDGINRKNVKNALAEFMKSLTTPNSRFDQWLKGDEDALSALEKHGYTLFKHYGCVSCHQGANVGGNMFQVFGVFNEYFRKRGNITDADLGRYNVTGNPSDRHAFKVPSLRMAALTAPYLHDGSAATLRDAVDAMFEFQLGREAPVEDKDAIVEFIKTLAGENNELFP